MDAAPPPSSAPPPPAAPLGPAELAALAGLDYRPDAVLKLAEGLRRDGFSPERTAEILTQARLRQEAAGKFGPAAASVLLTRPGLEQATRTAVARRHAARMAAAGIRCVQDLGCGLGADARAFAEAGLAVRAWEIDPFTAGCAAHNLASFPQAQVGCADVTATDLLGEDLPEGTALWLDPARREPTRRGPGGARGSGEGNGRRIFDPEAFSPPFSLVRELAGRGVAMGVKMGPGLDREAVPPGAEAEWISHGGEVVEVVLWFNALTRPGVRRAATVLGPDPLEPEVLAELTAGSGFGQGPQPPVGPPGQYLHEPDGAVVRAELVEDLVRATGGHLLDPRIAYVTSDQPTRLPWARTWRIAETLPLHVRDLRSWAKKRRVTELTVKKRGVDVVPEQLRRQVLAGSRAARRSGRHRGSGQQGGGQQGGAADRVAATLVLTRWDAGDGERRAAFVVEPV